LEIGKAAAPDRAVGHGRRGHVDQSSTTAATIEFRPRAATEVDH
jgi:hypothetical protein